MKSFTLNLFVLPAGRQVVRKYKLDYLFVFPSLRSQMNSYALNLFARSEIQMRLLICIPLASLTNKKSRIKIFIKDIDD